jgi:uncharacterized protein
MSGIATTRSSTRIRGHKAWESRRMMEPNGALSSPKSNALSRAPRMLGRALVKGYRYTLSPLIGFHCRHLPTCSEYADQALARHGLWAGSWITLARLCRCQPWGTSGLDFVCEELPPQSRWFLPWRYARWRGTQAEPK